MTPQELIDWGPVRCYSLVPREVIHQGVVIATSGEKVLVRDDEGRQVWWYAAQTEPVGAAGGTDG